MSRGSRGTRLRSSHLYQLHTYLAHFAGGLPLTGVLLYAQVDGPLRLDYRLADHRLLVRSLDLGQPWQGIHEDLLGLVEEIAGAAVPPDREHHDDLGGRGS